jgi:uncharacterized protein YjiS (DUF1127 family)
VRSVKGSVQSGQRYALAHTSYSHAYLKLIWRKNPHHLKVPGAAIRHTGHVGKGSLTLFNRMRTTMSLMNHTSEFSVSPFSMPRPLRVFGRRAFRVVNNAIAAVIAQREHQAQLTILRQLTERELRDIRLARSNIGAGLADAAKDRTRSQRLLMARV